MNTYAHFHSESLEVHDWVPRLMYGQAVFECDNPRFPSHQQHLTVPTAERPSLALWGGGGETGVKICYSLDSLQYGNFNIDRPWLITFFSFKGVISKKYVSNTRSERLFFLFSAKIIVGLALPFKPVTYFEFLFVYRGMIQWHELEISLFTYGCLTVPKSCWWPPQHTHVHTQRRTDTYTHIPTHWITCPHLLNISRHVQGYFADLCPCNKFPHSWKVVASVTTVSSHPFQYSSLSFLGVSSLLPLHVGSGKKSLYSHLEAST